MKAWIIATIARQVEGEYVFVKIEKGYTSAGKAESDVNAKAKITTEGIMTPQGAVNCVCERGVFEVEIDE